MREDRVLRYIQRHNTLGALLSNRCRSSHHPPVECRYPGIENLLRQAEVLLSRDHTDGVGVALATAPALDTDDVVALVDDAELETVVDTPLETAVNILLPDLDVEVGLLLGEEEGPDTTVQVGVLR